jgi:HSP20 family protein
MFDLIPFQRRSDVFFNSMMKSFNDIFESFAVTEVGTKPFRADLRETEKAYYVDAELPGFEKDDIRIELKKDELIISAKRNDMFETKDEDQKVIRRERHYGEFVRRFYLDRADGNGVRAKLENGMLRIEIPKRAQDTDGTKHISIE